MHCTVIKHDGNLWLVFSIFVKCSQIPGLFTDRQYMALASFSVFYNIDLTDAKL